MKVSRLLALLTIPMLVSGCFSKKNNKAFECEVTTHMDARVNPNKTKGYDVSFQYSDSFFDDSAKKYNHNLKLISFGSSLCTASQTLAKDFFTTLQFDNPTYSGYGKSTPDNVGYYIAHKTIKDYELVALSIRGFDYQQEWANNFVLGADGNHQGFEARANDVYAALKTYVASYSDKTLKLWISGYSRGGAISNVLADKIMTAGEIIVKRDDLFVYTFEAPNCLSEANARAYENVFNHINDTDLIASIPPSEYGLKRCGKDIVINQNKNVDQALKDFDSGAILPAFTADEKVYPEENVFVKYLFHILLHNTGVESTTINTRARYVANLETYIGYMMGLYFSLPQTTSNKILGRFQTLSNVEVLNFFTTPDKMYNFLKTIFDEDSISYDDNQLHTSANKIADLLNSKYEFFYTSFIDQQAGGIKESVKNNLYRMLDMHSPETVYALIK